MLIILTDQKNFLSTIIKIYVEKEYLSYTNYGKNNPMSGYTFTIECDKKNLAREVIKIIVKYCSEGKHKLRYYSKGQPTETFEQRWTFGYRSITHGTSMYIRLYKDYTDEKWELFFNITGMMTSGAKYYLNEKIVEIDNNIDKSYPYSYTSESDKREFQQIIDKLSRKTVQEGVKI